MRICFRFSQVPPFSEMATKIKGIHFERQGGIFMINKYWFSFPPFFSENTTWVLGTLYTCTKSCWKGGKFDFKVLQAWWTSVEMQSISTAAHQKSKYWLVQHTGIRYINRGPDQWDERYIKPQRLGKVLLWKCHQANESRRAESSCKSLLISSGFSIYSVAPMFAATANGEKWAGFQSIFTVQLTKKGQCGLWLLVKEKGLSLSESNY